jgi:hypothetical protein
MLTAKEKETLDQLTAQMRDLLDKAPSLSKADVTKGFDVLGDIETLFGWGVPTLRPDLPEEAQKMFVTLWHAMNEA